MASSSVTAETVRFISRILAVRQTSLEELPLVIAALDKGLQSLNNARSAPDVPKPASVPKRRAPVAAAPAAVVAPEPPRRRGRPRRQVVDEVVAEPEEIAAVEAPQPKLLRRAAMVAHEQDHHHELHTIARTPEGSVRGVVKWFDSRAGKGALRLTGISGDVTLEPEILARCNIKRLYKDQEIEATVQDVGGRTRLVSLTLPGRGTAPLLKTSLGGEVTGTLRRQPRQVTVEVKRDGMRMRSARAEAEHVLGNGRSKVVRRPTP